MITSTTARSTAKRIESENNASPGRHCFFAEFMEIGYNYDKFCNIIAFFTIYIVKAQISDTGTNWLATASKTIYGEVFV